MEPDSARSIKWLKEYAEIPPEGTWPRLMTGPHPRAVGSYGPKFIRWVTDHGRWPLWWWQQLVATRLLEHDVDGRLIWRVGCISTSRQVGKSYLISMLCMWRITQGHIIFDEPQPVTHTAKDLALAREVQKACRVYGKENADTYKVTEGAGNIAIEHRSTGSVWAIRALDAVYGHTSSVAVVDEAWAVRAEVVDDGLMPTMIQRRSPQLLLVSTANPKATGLMIGRRAAALTELDDPGDVLWLEWSAEPDADPAEPESWRQASPQWDENRRREISRAYATAEASPPADPIEPDPMESFSSQWLNRWRGEVEPRALKGEPLIDLDVWLGVEQDAEIPGPVVVAVEDYFGAGASLVAVAGLPDGRIYGEAETFAGRALALERAGKILAMLSCSRLIVGASLEKDPVAVELDAELAGSRETMVGLPLFRDLLAGGRLIHFQAQPLTDQLAEARVTKTAAGTLALIAGPRSDAVRAMVWALYSLEQDPPAVPMIYV